MRIMVFDVPAENGGALTILNQYYDTAIKDKENEWIFVVSTPMLKETNNVKVLNYPWIKISWVHRLYFDKFIAYKLVERYEVDEILSLQNVLIPHTNIKQKLYLHQPLPFVEKAYRITENFKFWMYQNVISRIIFKSIRKADKVIVQTKWIMDAAIQKTGTDKSKFILKQPELNIIVKDFYKHQVDKKMFFYPASGLSYKNHEIIVKACKTLSDRNKNNYEVVFTLDGNENKEVRKLREVVVKYNLPITFIGSIKIDKVYEYYSKSVLVFPSYIETFGLPMLEAKMHQTPVLASDCAFSHEILDGYENVKFFNPFDFDALAHEMELFLE